LIVRPDLRLAFGLAVLLYACATQGPRPPHELSSKSFPMPLAPNSPPVARLDDIETEVTALQKPIGGYPPRLASDDERDRVYARWSQAVVAAQGIVARGADRERHLYLLSELYRQGHNLDVRGAAAKALDTIEECLDDYPRSRRCNLSASYFYLATTGVPDRLERAEHSLTILRELAAPDLDDDAEAGLVWVAIYRRDQAETSRRIDRYVEAFPNSPRAEAFRKIRAAGGGTVRSGP
jgi:hypothetical protein